MLGYKEALHEHILCPMLIHKYTPTRMKEAQEYFDAFAKHGKDLDKKVIDRVSRANLVDFVEDNEEKTAGQCSVGVVPRAS